jgi:integrase/recombinase XerD
LVLQAAKKRAGILKPGSVHALRHSFATHLLDKGTDVTMIMKLLGHNDIKTTLRYLHVTNRDVLNIISPLDQLNLG